MKILVTGAAGFIGYHLAGRLLEQGETVFGIDNINDYYDAALKYGRLAALGLHPDGGEFTDGIVRSAIYPRLSFCKMDLADGAALKALFEAERFEMAVNLAAQAGVRYSLVNPDAYIASNVQGFLNVLEAVRACPVRHLVYASSSSVYGINTVRPFSESGAADHPASLYGATKRANELMAHSYSHLFNIPTTGLRFFTVYGPWGRPDMALFLFTRAILAREPVEVFNYGRMERDFTYIDDIIESLVRVMRLVPGGNRAWDGVQSGTSPAPARIYNIGNGAPCRLLDLIHALEAELGVKAQMRMLPMQPGDAAATWADCTALEEDTGRGPHTDIREGVKRFVAWYREFYTVDEIQQTNQQVVNIASQKVYPPVYVKTETVKLGEQALVLVSVDEGLSKPYKDTNGTIYVKNGSDKRKVTSNDEIARLLGSRNLSADETEVFDSGIKDIDGRLFAAYFKKEFEMTYEEKGLTLEEALIAKKVMRNKHLTLAGLLFFGIEPQVLRPAFTVKTVSFVGNDIGGSDYRSKPEDLAGTVPELFKQGMMFVKSGIKYLQNGQGFNSHGIPEVSIIALEEVLQNALIHRDYFKNAPVRLLIFENRIEIISPGKLPNSLTVEEVKYGNPVIRNNQIALFASRTLPYSGLGSGLRRAFQNQPDMELINDVAGDQFIVRLPRQ